MDFLERGQESAQRNRGKPEFWDFCEISDNVLFDASDGYAYEVLAQQRDLFGKANKFAKLRNTIESMVHYIHTNPQEWVETDLEDGVKLFLDVHSSYGESIDGFSKYYILAEIPKSTGFYGLNKPKELYKSHEHPIGPDQNLRPRWRKVYLTISPSEEKTMKLLLHELAHTSANHVQFRPHDHYEDFQKHEKFLTYVANRVNAYKKHWKPDGVEKPYISKEYDY